MKKEKQKLNKNKYILFSVAGRLTLIKFIKKNRCKNL